MKYPPVAFVLRFLEINYVHKVSICTDVNHANDTFNDWKSATISGLSKYHLVNAMPVEGIVDSINWPSKEETMLVLCPNFQWENSYPEWSYEKNVVWLAPDEPSRYDSEWSGNLRLDSRYFTYSNEDNEIKMRELYRIKKGPIMRQDYGTWNEVENVLNVPEPALWERRKDLQGVEIVDSILEWKPFIILDPEGNFSRTTGVHVDMLANLQNTLNFTVRKYSPADGQWGFLKKINETTSIMTGMVGDLVAKEADLSTAGLYITKERQVYTDMLAIVSDFTTLIMPASLASASAQIDSLAYVQIFSGSTWLLILAIGTAVVALFAITVSFLNNSSSILRSMSEGLQVSYLTMIQIGVRVSLDTTTKRIIFLTSSMVAFVAYSYYCSDLTALMTHRPPPVTIRNFQNVLDAGYYVRVVKGSGIENFFSFSDPNSAMGKLYQKVLDDPSLYFKGFTEAQEEIAVATDAVTFDSFLAYAGSSSFAVINNFEERIPTHVGWAFQYNSELTDVFQYHLTRMKESGVTTRIVDSWLYGRPDEIVDRIFIEDASSLGYDNLFFPQMILGFGMMLSLTIFLIERCMTWFGKRSSVLQLGSDFVSNIEFATSADEHLFGKKDPSPVIGF